MPYLSSSAQDVPRLYTAGDVSQILNASPRSIRRYRLQGLLPAVMVGGQVRYRPADVDAFIAAQLDAPVAPEDTTAEG